MVRENCYRLWGPVDWCDYEVGIETEFKTEIRNLFPQPWSGLRTEITIDIELVPEPSSERGQWTTSIRSDGMTLGYLDDETAAAWAGALRRVMASGLTPVTSGWICGHDYDVADGRRFWGQMYLALGDPSFALPLNEAPAAPHVMLPKSAVLQVTKEAQYLPALLKVLPPSGQGALIATLHERPAEGKANAVIEVRINDECVGQLAPQTSQKFLPMIRHFQDRGLVTACCSDVIGSKVAVEARIKAAKANEVSTDFLDGPAEMSLPLVPVVNDPLLYDLTTAPV